MAYITTVSSTICTSIPTVSYITACRPNGASVVLKTGAEGPDKLKCQWYFMKTLIISSDEDMPSLYINMLGP